MAGAKRLPVKESRQSPAGMRKQRGVWGQEQAYEGSGQRRKQQSKQAETVKAQLAMQATTAKLAQARTGLAASDLSSTALAGGLSAAMANMPGINMGKLSKAVAKGGGKPGNSGGNFGQGFVGALSKSLSKADSSQELWNRIARFRGGIYDIGGTHHDEGAYERDINVYRGQLHSAGEGMTNKTERRYLTKLMKAMNRVYGNRANVELIFDPWGSNFGAGHNPNPYGGHRAHGHISTPWF